MNSSLWLLCLLASVLVNPTVPWRVRPSWKLQRVPAAGLPAGQARCTRPCSELRKFFSQDYEEMIADGQRTESYARALQDVVQQGEDVVVDIGTGPFALLACQAAQAGARQVFAIEADPDAAESARQFLDSSQDSWTSKVTLIQGKSSDVTLPLAADVAVHELLGEIAGRESAAAIIRDAFARHVARSPRSQAGAWSVPARARSWFVPVELPTQEQLQARSGNDVIVLSAPKDAPLLRFKLFPFEPCALASPQCFEVLDFAAVALDPTVLTGKKSCRLMFECDRPGILGGFAIFITGEMTLQAVASADAAEKQDPASCKYFEHEPAPPGIGFCSAWLNTSWSNPFVRLNFGGEDYNTVHVERGDVIEVNTTVDLTPFKPQYTAHAMLRRQRGEDVEDEVLLDVAFE